MAENEVIRSVKHIGSRTGYFEINKVNEGGKEEKYKLIKKLSPKIDQGDLAKFYEKSKITGNPLPINSYQFGEILIDVLKSDNDNLKNYFFGVLKKNWIMTSTKIIYSLKDLEHWSACSLKKKLDDSIFQIYFRKRGKDEIVHNYGTFDSFSFLEDLLGNNGEIKELKNENISKKLFGSNFEDLNEKSFYLKGFNKIPQKTGYYFGPESDRPKFEYSADLNVNISRFSENKIDFNIAEKFDFSGKSFLVEGFGGGK